MGLLTVVKATRMYRTIMPLSAILIPAAFAGRVGLQTVLLSLACILVYCGASLHNALRDNDYDLPGYTRYMLYIFPVAALAVSLSSKVIFLTVLCWIVLGVTYNTIARRILFGDIFIMSITHAFLPVASSSLLLGLDPLVIIRIALFVALVLFLFGNMKNIKDAESDKHRGYKTVFTTSRLGEKVTRISFALSLACIVMSFVLFDLYPRYLLVCLVIFALAAVAFLDSDKEKIVKVARLIFIVFLSGLAMSMTNDPVVIIMSLCYLSFILWMHFRNSFINLLEGIICIVKTRAVK